MIDNNVTTPVMINTSLFPARYASRVLPVVSVIYSVNFLALSKDIPACEENNLTVAAPPRNVVRKYPTYPI